MRRAARMASLGAMALAATIAAPGSALALPRVSDAYHAPWEVRTELRRLAREHPDLAPALLGVLAVVGGAQVSRTHPLSAGDELALLMPLSGG